MSLLPPDLDPDTLTVRVFGYCRHLMTDAEQAAERCTLHRFKAAACRRAIDNPQPLDLPAELPEWIKEFERNHDPIADHRRSLTSHLDTIKELSTPPVRALLKDGPEAFRANVRDRLLREHRAEVINPCPRCGATTRTPRARQCPRCKHDWH